MSADSRISRAFEHAYTLPLRAHSRIVLFSDCHRGDGTSNDNFLKNRHLYLAALRYYYEHGYTYIELGDGDELWENRSMEQIAEIHQDILDILCRFHRQDRLYLLYGNHDMVKKNMTYVARHCIFPAFHEAIILRDCCGTNDLYLIHGHQADFLNSALWRLARFLVRYLWKPLEHTGVLDPTSAAKNHSKKELVERNLSAWATAHGHILITGHTHRPTLPEEHSLREPAAFYCNTGSCVHPMGITCIELADRTLTLVKWSLNIREDSSLYVKREIL